jgi:hypothetical protein
VDSVRYDMVAQCGAGGQPKLYFNMTHTRLWRWCYARRNFEPVDLPLLLSQTNYNWSLAPVEAHVDSATPNVALAAAHASLIGISFYIRCVRNMVTIYLLCFILYAWVE